MSGYNFKWEHMEALRPLPDRLNLLAEYIEHPHASRFDTAAEMIGAVADELEKILAEIQQPEESPCTIEGVPHE